MSPSRRPRSERSTQRRPIRVVPMRGPGGLVAPAARVAAPPTAQLTYRGGPLLTAVEVVTVYWGAAWNEPAAQATAQSLNAFFQFVVSSPYIDQLGEYNTPQQKIGRDRKSTRLNSSHSQISYAVFCLKKKKKTTERSQTVQRRPQHHHPLESRRT